VTAAGRSRWREGAGVTGAGFGVMTSSGVLRRLLLVPPLRGRGVTWVTGRGLGFEVGLGTTFGLAALGGGGVASGTVRISSRALRNAFFRSESPASCARASGTARTMKKSSEVKKRTGAHAMGQVRFANCGVMQDNK